MEVFVLSIEYVNERIRLFGIDGAGAPAHVVVSDFEHHVYGKAADITALLSGEVGDKPARDPARVERQSKINGYGYNEREPFYKLADCDQSVIREWTAALKDAGFAPFNSSLSPIQQFMMTTGFHGGGWISLSEPEERRRHEGIYEAPMAALGKVDSTRYPPSMRIASFDIETVKDRTVQIATAFYTIDHTLSKISCRVLAQTLRRANPIRGAEVRFYGRDRKKMYEEWRDELRAFDPHILTGYNIKNFDIPHIIDDAASCGLQGAEFSIARPTIDKNNNVVRLPMTAKVRAKGGSKQVGVRKQTDITIGGIVVLDVYEAVLKNPDRKFKSNKLGYVAKELLGYTKLDVEYKEIPRIVADTSPGWIDRMTHMLDYNRVDATLPFDIAERQKNIGDMIAMSRVAGGQLEWVYGRGETCKAVALIAREMFLADYVMPDMRKPRDETVTDEKDDEKFEGAVVIDPVTGIYDYLRNPDGSFKLDEHGNKIPAFVTTVDFASLYPSIIRAFNFCFTTLLLSGKAPDGWADGDTVRSKFDALFVAKGRRRGILPAILDVLTDNRAAVRARQKPLVAAQAKALAAAVEGTPEYADALAALKRAQESPEYQALECMQLAIKRVSNSIYGATGSPNFFMPCVEIAASVTAEGRCNIREKTVPFILSKDQYPNAIIVYGDTDSVFVVLGLPTMEATMAAGKKLAADITAFINLPPIKLEWEKVLWPFIIPKKKNYYGRYWTNAKNPDKLYVRGMPFIKSSACAFVNRACNRVCEMVALEMQPMSAVLAHIKTQCADLYRVAADRSDDSLLLYMKNGKEKYNGVNGITELIRKNDKRGGAPIELGERVPYYVVRNAEKKNAYKVEHEAYVRQHDEIEIDVAYYVEKQWRNTLHSLLPGYEVAADRALLPPSQSSIVAFASDERPSSNPFAVFAAQQAEASGKRGREKENEKEKEKEEPKKRTKKAPAEHAKKRQPDVVPPAPEKKLRLISDFFTVNVKK